MSFLMGEKAKMKKFDTLTHQQKDVLHSLLKHLNIGGSGIQKQPLYNQGTDFLSSILSQDPEMMQQFEAPAMRQFNEEIVPGIAERFSGMGAQSSSAFNQAMGQQAGSLSERLASMRAGLGMQAANQGMSYAQLPFQQMMQRGSLGMGIAPFGQQAFQGQPGALQGIMGGLGQGFGAGAGMGIMGLLGGLL